MYANKTDNVRYVCKLYFALKFQAITEWTVVHTFC